ncbi:uncharacterized protein LOC119452354 [Dermacentor silvarum]|uniref:uncharacterized protein LOC119452354 n=1 Tax=Dermacentor silvarum TaxID=543639 RepID=UPI0021010468|nr:uncharacterized protein LOC119452354 [Dermacentor silvarum]
MECGRAGIEGTESAVEQRNFQEGKRSCLLPLNRVDVEQRSSWNSSLLRPMPLSTCKQRVHCNGRTATGAEDAPKCFHRRASNVCIATGALQQKQRMRQNAFSDVQTTCAWPQEHRGCAKMLSGSGQPFIPGYMRCSVCDASMVSFLHQAQRLFLSSAQRVFGPDGRASQGAAKMSSPKDAIRPSRCTCGLLLRSISVLGEPCTTETRCLRGFSLAGTTTASMNTATVIFLIVVCAIELGPFLHYHQDRPTFIVTPPPPFLALCRTFTTGEMRCPVVIAFCDVDYDYLGQLH